MAKPVNDDPDRDKRPGKDGGKPMRRPQNLERPRKLTPQQQAQEDRLLLQEGEKQGWEQRGPESFGADEAGEAGKPRITRMSRVPQTWRPAARSRASSARGDPGSCWDAHR